MNTEQLLKEAISSLKNMSTDELEKYIEKRYTEKAPQKELDKLETEYATRVLEEDLTRSGLFGPDLHLFPGGILPCIKSFS